jgi:hypothetical protein
MHTQDMDNRRHPQQPENAMPRIRLSTLGDTQSREHRQQPGNVVPPVLQVPAAPQAPGRPSLRAVFRAGRQRV